MTVSALERSDPVAALGAEREIAMLRERVADWLADVDLELREPLAAAFAGTPKSFRPLTLFAAHRAVHETAPPQASVELAFAIELAHNMSLIVDDVLDESELRRGTPTLHRGFGRLPALMASTGRMPAGICPWTWSPSLCASRMLAGNHAGLKVP